jgi:hypothetical protein
MPGDDEKARRDTAMRHRNTRQLRRRDRRADARDNLERDTRHRQRERFLGAAAEHERVSAFQPDDALAGARTANHQAVDRLLADALASRALADAEALRVRQAAERLRVDQRVVQNQVRPFDVLHRTPRPEFWISGPRTYESNSW